MKKLLLLVLLTVPIFCFAQTDTITKKQKNAFCEVEAYPHGSQYEIIINDGSQTKENGKALKDGQGKTMKFDTIVTVLNYVSKLGWTFVSSYALVLGGSSIGVGFIFEKPLTQ